MAWPPVARAGVRRALSATDGEQRRGRCLGREPWRSTTCPTIAGLGRACPAAQALPSNLRELKLEPRVGLSG
eukprot:scaffold4015_cov161-Prasinococcus_capsulatus_cf.AAC.1